MADHLINKAFAVLSTYNASSANGVTPYRVVKMSGAGSGVIDLCTDATATTLQIGVVQDAIDQVKVATGKTLATVKLQGTTKCFVNTTPGTINIGTRVMCGSAGGVIAAATTGSKVLGIVVGATSNTGTISAGDIVDVQLTPGVLF
jgi:hypothetical protein